MMKRSHFGIQIPLDLRSVVGLWINGKSYVIGEDPDTLVEATEDLLERTIRLQFICNPKYRPLGCGPM